MSKDTSKEGILKYSKKTSYSKFKISKFRILKAKRKNVAKSLQQANMN